ncbi:Alpha/Beta hydrolase protein [Talaromyces proteolyticus]|uniref:Alpha/Beta hydrolase protein n=1 Tax=Talaromyces proteolyticus TaxID=1131652 RepID=A0AAD4PZ27_9EURO|nr:Alpha/Beta hydrolase protein [Talaromyces proteolyticus]KAH8695337.1 Alpha/Beta hydrolase protein [Talaromyces proteolyticus]
MLLESFFVKTVPYKEIDGGAPIFLDVMIPKHLSRNLHAVHIHLHGGFLVTGARNNLDIIPPRIFSHTIQNDIILVSPDYRLLPESNGLDIHEDMKDMWIWIRQSLNRTVESMTTGASRVDLQKIVVSGESAGGYLALQLALSHPTEIRAVIASYPMVDMRHPHFSQAGQKQIGAYPQYPETLISEHLQQSPDGANPTMREFSRQSLSIALMQHGRYLYFFGHDRELFPIERLEDDASLAPTLPFIWIHHGTADSEVPIDGSRKFVDLLKRQNPGARIRYEELVGAEHGIDSEMFLIRSGEWERGIRVVNNLLFGEKEP